jgi:hypothetical protein
MNPNSYPYPKIWGRPFIAPAGDDVRLTYFEGTHALEIKDTSPLDSFSVNAQLLADFLADQGIVGRTVTDRIAALPVGTLIHPTDADRYRQVVMGDGTLINGTTGKRNNIADIDWSSGYVVVDPKSVG